MPTPEDIQARIDSIFFPNEEPAKRQVMEAGCRFAYYTNANVATSILRNQQIWMRNASTMNDYKEVAHGFECLKKAYETHEAGKIFRKLLDTSFPGFTKDMEALFNGWLPQIRGHTYMTCVSEHSIEEDDNGRLSMWRAYGGDAGVALVLNGQVMFRESHALKAYAFPVQYLSSDEFGDQFAMIVKNIEREADYVKSLGREKVRNIVFNMLRSAVTCTKHPGFREEREWRVVASPEIYKSDLLKQSVEVVHGIPQVVLKIDLKNHPDQNLTGLEMHELLNRIIIGPCQAPEIIRAAFLKLLIEAGVPEPAKKIFVSDIPLRRVG